MALVQTIDGVPSYTTIQEALNWGSQYGVSNYHTHVVAGEIVYMAGSTHDEVTSAIRLNQSPTQTSTPSGGGGGGY